MIAGARILITGASSGIGRETAMALARSGAVVGLVGRRADLLAAALAECQASSPSSRMWTGDLGDLEWAEGLVDEAWDAFGGLDVLINNAAVPKVRAGFDLAASDVEQTMRVNFFSPVRMTLRLLPRFLSAGAGTIVNVGSVGGRMGIAHEPAYCASKFALTGWSEAMAIDLYGSGVRVVLVQPGPVNTDIWNRPGEQHAVYDGPLEPPSVVAEGILAAVEGKGFEHYLPDLKHVVKWKDSAIDDYIAMVGSMLLEKKGEP
jgi:NAD(P)-dependent dehydrogenase (short-subunit alcohol dehydrogenase family)